MLNVSFRDNRDAIKELLIRKMHAAAESAALVLSTEYKKKLDTRAPPHSVPGAIPHRYFGWLPDGYGPVNGDTRVNNTTLQDFSSDQGEHLKEFIQSGRSGNGAVVGFEPSHVTTREQNYLLGWDQGNIPSQPGVRRPWVRPVFDIARNDMAKIAREKAKEAE